MRRHSRPSVPHEDAEVVVGDDLCEEQLRADETCNLGTVARLNAHEERQRREHVGTDQLEETRETTVEARAHSRSLVTRAIYVRPNWIEIC